MASVVQMSENYLIKGELRVLLCWPIAKKGAVGSR
jgi:hypothetical protein